MIRHLFTRKAVAHRDDRQPGLPELQPQITNYQDLSRRQRCQVRQRLVRMNKERAQTGELEHMLNWHCRKGNLFIDAEAREL